MYEIHNILHEYTQFITDKDIKKIEITDNELIFTLRNIDVKLVCPQNDKRVTPLGILNYKNYGEIVERKIIFQLLKNGDIALDIGANVGWYSLSLARNGVEVYAFEPIKRTYEILMRNIELNNLTNINAFNFGFFNTSGKKTFYYYQEASGNASAAHLNHQVENQLLECDVKTLDEFVFESGINKLDFIKCDVEGSELFVFQGGMHSINQYKPIIYTEMLRKWSAPFGYHPNDIIKLFGDLGYRCFTAIDRGLREFFYMDDETEETNFFFLHDNMHKKIIDDWSTELE